MWDKPPYAAEVALGLLLESRLQRPYKSHLMLVSRQMTFL